MDAVETTSATFPTGRHRMAVVWAGSHAYVFGGGDTTGVNLDDVVRYDPATDTPTALNSSLPQGAATSPPPGPGSTRTCSGAKGPSTR